MRKDKLFLIASISLIMAFFFDNWLSPILFVGTPKILLILTKFGNGLIIGSVATLFLLLRKDHKSKIFALLSALVISLSIAGILKYLIARPRPILDTIQKSTFAFPSGHTTAAFTTLAFMGKDKFLFTILAIIIALSRLLLGVHYLSDVVAGAILGYFTGYFLYKMYKANVFFKTPLEPL